MFTTLPIYDHCTAIAAELTAAIQAGHPNLEARQNNDSPTGPILIEVRNPLNGDCWTTVGSVGTRGNNENTIDIGIGMEVGEPLTRISGTVKKRPDTAAAGRAFVEFLTAVKKRQEVEINEKRWIKAGETAATAINSLLDKVEGNAGPQDKPYLYARAIHQREFVEKYRQAVVGFHIEFQLHRCWVSPETAEKIVELWKPIAQMLNGEPIEQETPNSCPAVGTLVN